MARLRRESSESYNGDIRTRREDTSRTATESHRRTSPRKKTARSYVDSNNVDSETCPDPALTPKTRRKPVKQIRLAPIASLASRSSNLELNLATKLYGPPKGRLHNSLAKKEGPTPTLDVAKCQALSPLLNDDLQTAEDDIEESVICDSNGSTTDSDYEELPSPSKFLNIQPKQRNTEPSRIADITDGLGKLLIDRPIIAKPVIPNRTATHPRVCPTSPSDKGHPDLAFLHYSPPRLHVSPRKQRSPERPVTPPPSSPSKGKLQSPSKKNARIPTPPFRPSLDAFWNAETVNDWNDQYSPKKEWKSPRKLRLLDEDAFASPTSSPRKALPSSPSKRSKAEIAARKDWETRKHVVAESFLAELDQELGDGQVQQLAASTGGVRLIWSKSLNSTAGRANWKRETTRTRQCDGGVSVTYKHFASIELAEKVIDDETRLLNVIAHEFCHLCNFMISGIKDQPHGKQFKEWGRRATNAFGSRGVEVTTKHAYQISYKFVWRCENDDCGAEFKRHSKSIDPARQTCGACRGKLLQIKPVPRKNNAGGESGYAGFVKQNFKDVKRSMPGASQKEVMEAIGRRYREQKKDREISLVHDAVREPVSSLLLDEEELVVPDSARASSEEVEDQVDKVARHLEFVVLDD